MLVVHFSHWIDRQLEYLSYLISSWNRTHRAKRKILRNEEDLTLSETEEEEGNPEENTEENSAEEEEEQVGCDLNLWPTTLTFALVQNFLG